MALLFLAPFRCRVCRGRFYRMWRPSLRGSTDPPVAPVLFMPPPRKVPDVDSMAPASIASPIAEPELAPPLSDPIPGAVLILEHDLSTRKLLGRLLERRGYEIVEIAEADKLAGEMLDRRVDLLIADVAMAETGVEAVVKLARALPSLKVLALSSEPLAENEIPERLLVLPKPFSLDNFVDGVDRLTKRSS